MQIYSSPEFFDNYHTSFPAIASYTMKGMSPRRYSQNRNWSIHVPENKKLDIPDQSLLF